jgi:hypothetical protein
MLLSLPYYERVECCMKSKEDMVKGWILKGDSDLTKTHAWHRHLTSNAPRLGFKPNNSCLAPAYGLDMCPRSGCTATVFSG